MARDKADERLLEELREDARASFADLGRRLRLSESSVRRRVRALQKSGAIRRFTVELGEDDATRAMALVSIDSAMDAPDVSREVRKLPGVRTVYEITGQYDIVVMMSAPSISLVNRSIDSLRKVRGVVDTNTVIILRAVS